MITSKSRGSMPVAAGTRVYNSRTSHFSTSFERPWNVSISMMV